MSKTMALNVDTGSILVEVKDKGEKIGEFRFNPCDLDIAKRYEKVADVLSNLKVSDDPDMDEVFAFSDKIKEQFAATSRCMPFEQEHLSDVCPVCGKPAKSSRRVSEANRDFNPGS